MNPIKTYRDNGAIGALLDEYEKAIIELKEVIQDIPSADLIIIADTETKDQDCISIQTILTHTVGAGYNYVVAIRKWKGEDLVYKKKELLDSIEEYTTALNEMFSYNEKLFEDYPNLKLEEYKSENKIKVKWGQQYDVEQLFEHAIVHILRHRRQIERFQIKLKTTLVKQMNKESFLREYMNEIWNNKNFDKIEKYVHPEYTIHVDAADPWEGKTLSYSEFKERLNFSFNSFPDMNFEITSAIPEENHVAITWILRGSHLGMIGSYPPTGNSVNTTGITIYHFKEGLINGHTQVFDRRTVMKQLGFGE